MDIKQDTRIKKSKIAGKGCFANKEIEEGQTICFLGGKCFSLEEILRRENEGKEDPSDPLQFDDEEYLDLYEMFRIINHSCEPNSYIKGKNELIALHGITVDEEITYDYSTAMNDNEEKIKTMNAEYELWTCKCNCGSKKCRGVIDQFKTLSEETRDYYIKNRFMPDFMIKNWII